MRDHFSNSFAQLFQTSNRITAGFSPGRFILRMKSAMVCNLLIIFLIPSFLISQENVAQEKALKYHKALQRRPVPGYLFDRFYNTWLDSSSLADLEKFLQDKAESPTAESSDRLLLDFIPSLFWRSCQDERPAEQ